MWTRRQFAGLAASASLTPLLSAVSTARTSARASIAVRKDAATLDASSPDIVALKAAVVAMKALPANDRRNWTAQANIHGTFSGGFGACQHGNWYFLPWHRMYLYFFEEIVRELSGMADFALPYWDWSTTPRLPAAYWGTGNPLANPPRSGVTGSGRRAGLTETTEFTQDEKDQFVGLARISRLVRITDFETFAGGAVAASHENGGAGSLEGSPHNFVHRWVGGDMVTGGSSYDPIFWAHHANIDRLWTEWTLKNPLQTPTDPGWLATTFNDFADRSGAPTGMDIARTLNPTALNYRYDRRPASPLVPTAPVQPLNTLARVSFAAPAMSPSGLRATFSRASDPSASRVINSVVDGGAAERDRTIRVRLSGIKIPADQDVALRVFINCKHLGADIPLSDPSYVTTLTFFGHGQGMGHGHAAGGESTASYLINATPAFARLYGDRPFGPDEPLSVTVVTTPLFPGTSAAPAPTVQSLSPSQVALEVVAPRG